MKHAHLDRREFIRLAVGTAALSALGLAGCAPAQGGGASTAAQAQADYLQQDPQTATLFLFDTQVVLKAYCSPELMERLVERCTYFEERFSRTRQGSDVWNINNAGGQPVEVAAETADLIARSLEYCRRSGGVFDITIGAVSELWDFTEGVKPADELLEQAVEHVGYQAVHVDGTRVWLDDPLARIDLGGTAKGYIADDLAALLEGEGCQSACLNLGGNVYVLGSKPDGSAWNVGVEDPNAAGSSVIAKAACRSSSVVTSGLYERHFVQDGVDYYHILNPQTGYPAKTDVLACSVLSASSLEGDACATTMFLLGKEKALQLLESLEGVEGLVVEESGLVTQSSGRAFELLGEGE
ncbi:MAG: FAD:protein FMN transferase [Coriobacteriales bacterium]